MSYLTPVMACITLIISLFIEPWHHLGETTYFDTSRHIFESCALMLLGGALAFFMVTFLRYASEFSVGCMHNYSVDGFEVLKVCLKIAAY